MKTLKKKFKLKLEKYALNYYDGNFYIFGGLSTNKHFHNDIIKLEFLDENKKFTKILIHEPISIH